jgi:hypothetical protein
MCNLYSITANQAAIIALFRVKNRYVGNLPPMPGVFPDYPAPVVRNAGRARADHDALGHAAAEVRWAAGHQYPLPVHRIGCRPQSAPRPMPRRCRDLPSTVQWLPRVRSSATMDSLETQIAPDFKRPPQLAASFIFNTHNAAHGNGRRSGIESGVLVLPSPSCRLNGYRATILEWPDLIYGRHTYVLALDVRTKFRRRI